MELRHETLKDQLSKLDPEVQRLRSENEMLARHSGDLAVEEQKLEGENSRLEEDNRKKSCQVDQRRQSNEVLQQQNNELQDQVREQERRLIQLQTVEQPQLEARLREIQGKINDCIGRFASLNDQIHEAEDQQSEAVETLSRLTGQLQEAKARREEAQRQKRRSHRDWPAPAPTRKASSERSPRYPVCWRRKIRRICRMCWSSSAVVWLCAGISWPNRKWTWLPRRRH